MVDYDLSQVSSQRPNKIPRHPSRTGHHHDDHSSSNDCIRTETFLVGHQIYMIGYYYTRPMFIAVSGMAIVLYERKYRCPFRMIVHGIVLFLMAWCADIITHQSFSN